MKIYTKTGDKGLTSLFDGTRVKKFHPRVEAYGTIDELNSALGVALFLVKSGNLKARDYSTKFIATLEQIQNDLLDIGSYLANPEVNQDQKFTKEISGHTLKFEEYIDEMTKELPQLNNFILPGGGGVGSLLHFVRSVSRRAERRIVELGSENKIEPSVLIYLNRLSDLFFTMSRFANFKEGIRETIWTKK